jgi:hypothetical protein
LTHRSPVPSIDDQLVALERMTASQLQARYAEVFGEPSRSGNRQWLLRRVAWRIQALAEGGLSERARQRAAELARDADVRVVPPRAGNGLGRPTSPTSLRLTANGPAPGTVLTRVYHGVEHRVTVLPDGFEYNGMRYRSLSAIASAITGSHWNGRLFFGLVAPRATGRIISKEAR